MQFHLTKTSATVFHTFKEETKRKAEFSRKTAKIMLDKKLKSIFGAEKRIKEKYAEKTQKMRNQISLGKEKLKTQKGKV